MSDQHASDDSEIPIPEALLKIGYQFDPKKDDSRFWLVPGYLQTLGHSKQESERMIEDYKREFMDEEFCKSIGRPVHSDEFLGHEGPAAIAIMIHYYIGLRGDPDWNSYLDWRTEFQKSKAHADWQEKLKPSH